jgi:hypothetical protein
MQGNGTGPDVALDTSGTVGMWEHPSRREGQGDGAVRGVVGGTTGQGARERRAQGEAAIRSLEMT